MPFKDTIHRPSGPIGWHLVFQLLSNWVTHQRRKENKIKTLSRWIFAIV
jgi:hypothetical protein